MQAIEALLSLSDPCSQPETARELFNEAFDCIALQSDELLKRAIVLAISVNKVSNTPSLYSYVLECYTNNWRCKHTGAGTKSYRTS